MKVALMVSLLDTMGLAWINNQFHRNCAFPQGSSDPEGLGFVLRPQGMSGPEGQGTEGGLDGPDVAPDALGPDPEEIEHSEDCIGNGIVVDHLLGHRYSICS